MDNENVLDDSLVDIVSGIDVVLENSEIGVEIENIELSSNSVNFEEISYSDILNSIENGFTNLESSILSLSPCSSLDSSDFSPDPCSFILTLILMFVALVFFFGGKK